MNEVTGRAVIVTGSRNWADEETIAGRLDRASQGASRLIVIHGAQRGADACAATACKQQLACFTTELPMPAQWDDHGKAAGPIRNARMLEVLLALGACGYDILVLAFPHADSRGTWVMVKKAKAAGVAVDVWKPALPV